MFGCDALVSGVIYSLLLISGKSSQSKDQLLPARLGEIPLPLSRKAPPGMPIADLKADRWLGAVSRKFTGHDYRYSDADHKFPRNPALGLSEILFP